MATPEQHSQLMTTTAMLIEAGVGAEIREVCGADIDLYRTPREATKHFPARPARHNIANWIEGFVQAELPMTVAGTPGSVERDEMYEGSPAGSYVALHVVKIVPETLEIYRNFGFAICSVNIEESELADISPDSSFVAHQLCLGALEVYKLQQAFDWQPQFEGLKAR